MDSQKAESEEQRAREKKPKVEGSKLILVLGVAIFIMGLGAFVAKELLSYRIEQTSPLPEAGAIYRAFDSVINVTQERLLRDSDVNPDKQHSYNTAFIGLFLEQLSPSQQSRLDGATSVLVEFGRTLMSVDFWLVALLLAITYYFMEKRFGI